MPPPEICPNCGAEVPPNARVCAECGSDEETGWGEAARQDALNLPEDGFDYQRFVENEFGKEGRGPTGVRWFWWLIAVVLLAAFVVIFLR